jgi:PAS domain S-box-containing protein
MNVLYVEDYAIAAALVRDTFRRRAPYIHLEIVATVAQALARLQRFEQAQADPSAAGAADTPAYDLVLTDLNLPDGLGLDILSHVRSRSLPLAVVILTGSGQEDSAIGALRAGANDYVTKRDDYLSLLPRTLDTALERFRSEAERASHPLRVLYADADIEDVERVRIELKRRAPHIAIRAANSAAEMLAQLHAGSPAASDVILIDDRLPGMPIIDLVKQTSVAVGFDVPIVLVTGQGNERIAQLAIRIGAADYLNKSDVYLERLPFALESAHLKAASVRERSALRKSEAEFRTLANNLPDIVMRFDRAGRHLYVSPMIESLTGRSPSLYIGKTNAELGVSDELQQVFGETLQRVLDAGKQQRTEFVAETKTGHRWFDAVVAPELDAAGRVHTVLLIARDITNRKVAEASVRDAGLLARNTLDALSAQVAIVDHEGAIIAVNSAWRNFAVDNGGVAARVLEGANYLTVCDGARSRDGEEGGATAVGIRAVMQGELEEFSLEYPCHSPTEQRWFTVRVTRFAGGGDKRVVIAHENITTRKLAESRLAHHRDHLEEQVMLRTKELARANTELAAARDTADRANRAKSDFLAHMSHEMRTPMSSIIGMARIMRGELVDAQPLQHLAKLRGAADHLLRIVDDVLDLTKIEAGQMDLEETEFSLRQVLTHAADMLQQHALEKGFGIETEIDPLLPEILTGDALRLEQIVLNFLGNAVKFTSTGGVRLRARHVRSNAAVTTLRIEVQDTGIGIAAEQQERLFQTFSQADESIARKFGGSGLGLVIAKRLAALMQGDVGVASELGRGSTFWATATFRSSLHHSTPSLAATRGPSDLEMVALRGMSALVVEDDPVNQLVTAHTLRALGLAVEVADNGAEALSRLQSGRYSIVLMDMHMPVMDGLSATRLIRATHDRLSLPVIAMTATALEEDKIKCLEAGMNEHISKPIDPDQLRQTLLRYAAKG